MNNQSIKPKIEQPLSPQMLESFEDDKDILGESFIMDEEVSSFEDQNSVEQEFSSELEPPLPEQKKQEENEQQLESLPVVEDITKVSRPKQTKIPQVRDEVVLAVEKILSEGLEGAFVSLTPVQQQEFKHNGEVVSIQIAEMLKKTRVNVKKVFALVLSWLKFLPGINKFFLEQEAKIKTDHILALKKDSQI